MCTLNLTQKKEGQQPIAVIVTGSKDQSVRVWYFNFDTLKIVPHAMFGSHLNSISSVAINENGTKVGFKNYDFGEDCGYTASTSTRMEFKAYGISFP